MVYTKSADKKHSALIYENYTDRIRILRKKKFKEIHRIVQPAQVPIALNSVKVPDCKIKHSNHSIKLNFVRLSQINDWIHFVPSNESEAGEQQKGGEGERTKCTSVTTGDELAWSSTCTKRIINWNRFCFPFAHPIHIRNILKRLVRFVFDS